MSPPKRQPPEGGWGELTVEELGAELEARGLKKSGKKAELVARLEEDDAASGAPEAAEEEAPEAEAPEAEAPEAEAAEEEALEAEAPEAEEPEAEAVPEEPADADEAAAGEKPRRRRGSAETTTTRARRKAAARPDGGVTVSARAKYVRSAPRKARLVMQHIRGKEVERARAILAHTPRAVSEDILKLLNSAVANAESSYELGPDELKIEKAFVDEGPTIKRYRPRAMGRATRINKRTSHMTIELTTTEGNGR